MRNPIVASAQHAVERPADCDEFFARRGGKRLFDQRVDAMMRLLAHPVHGHYTVDAMRRAIESLPRDEYFGLGYYERWVRAIRQLVVEKGLLTEDEIKRRLAALQAEARAS